MIFQGPTGYVAQMCEVHSCSMETVKQNGRFTLFLVNSTLIYSILFECSPFKYFSAKYIDFIWLLGQEKE